MCEKLASQGADCKWRAAFALVGNLLLSVSNVASFVSSRDVQDAAVSTVANITSLPERFISANMDADVGEQTRRLSSTADGKVMLTYACSVSGDAQPTPTGEEVSVAMTSANLETFTFLFRNDLGKLFGEGVFEVNALSASAVILTISGGASTTNQSSSRTSTTSGTTSTPFQSPRDDESPEDSDAPAVAASSLAHGLIFVSSSFCLLRFRI